jgi:hypothetical protein
MQAARRSVSSTAGEPNPSHKGANQMTQAKTRVSTPRRTASKIKAEPVASRDLRHAKAFRDLESPMHDLFCQSEIAADIITGVDRGKDWNEITHFAVYQLCEMVRAFRAKYRVDLHAGKTVQS